MSAWSHLPNAHHIDWVFNSAKNNPELWDAARDAARDAAWDAAWDAARYAVRDAAWDAARYAAWDAAWKATSAAARYATRYADRYAAWATARGMISALVAYDDCDHFLNMNYEKLQVWAVLSEDPRAILLLPMVYVREKLLQEVAV